MIEITSGTHLIAISPVPVPRSGDPWRAEQTRFWGQYQGGILAIKSTFSRQLRQEERLVWLFYYEAAAIDGADFLHQFFYITLSLLSPVTFFILVTGVIGTFQDFTVPFIMTGGGPARATQLVVMYLYGLAFRLQNMGTASAVAYIVFIVIVTLTALNFLLARRWVFYEENV